MPLLSRKALEQLRRDLESGQCGAQVSYRPGSDSRCMCIRTPSAGCNQLYLHVSVSIIYLYICLHNFIHVYI